MVLSSCENLGFYSLFHRAPKVRVFAKGTLKHPLFLIAIINNNHRLITNRKHRIYIIQNFSCTFVVYKISIRTVNVIYRINIIFYFLKFSYSENIQIFSNVIIVSILFLFSLFNLKLFFVTGFIYSIFFINFFRRPEKPQKMTLFLKN